MPIQDVLEAIEREISQLQQVRFLLGGGSAVKSTEKRRGRPKGSTNKARIVSASVTKKAAKRSMSPEGRARIAAAQKARWAAQKKAVSLPTKVAKKMYAKKTPATKAVTAKKSSTSPGKPRSGVKAAIPVPENTGV